MFKCSDRTDSCTGRSTCPREPISGLDGNLSRQKQELTRRLKCEVDAANEDALVKARPRGFDEERIHKDRRLAKGREAIVRHASRVDGAADRRIERIGKGRALKTMGGD